MAFPSTLTAMALALSAAGAMVPASTQTSVDAGADGAAVAAADMVAGIIGYTRWPPMDGPLRLCVIGQSLLTGRMVDRTLLNGRALVVRAIPPAAATGAALPALGCHALYIAQGVAATRAPLLRGAN
ncbi:MAG: YfiR/HmsC family protein, partial [Sphingopyxis sp.]